MTAAWRPLREGRRYRANRSLTAIAQDAAAMSLRTRARAILIPLFFYAVLGSASAYLVYNASRGQHGTDARLAFDRETRDLNDELAKLSDERERWHRLVDSLRNESIDRDLLDEVARDRLDRANKDDVVIFTGAAPRR
jgi:cell division protein FtsB